MGFSRVLRLVSVVLHFRPLGTEKNDSRRRFIDIDVCDPPLNRYGKVARPSLCLQNACENHFFRDPGFHILATRSWLPHPGFHILASRSWLPHLGLPHLGLPHPGFHILACTSWLPDLGFLILASTSWLPDPGYHILASHILATRSWLPHPGFQILATRS